MREFSGALVLFAEEASGTSDALTKPAAANAAWKIIDNVEILKKGVIQHEEPFSAPDPDTGWADGKDVFTLADFFDATMRSTNELTKRLSYGVAAPIVQGTAQTPFAKADRRVRGWIKIQNRLHLGTDRERIDIWCDVRLKEDPATEKKVQIPVLEFWKLKSALNTHVMPIAA